MSSKHFYIAQIIILPPSLFLVVFGISSLVYAAARGQDIVGLEVQFTFGWSCVSSWIATIIAFLNAIMTLVMICVYLDRLNERVIQVRFDLGMDNLSIRSNSLRRINENLDMLEAAPSPNEQSRRNIEPENDTDIQINEATESDGSKSVQTMFESAPSASERRVRNVEPDNVPMDDIPIQINVLTEIESSECREQWNSNLESKNNQNGELPIQIKEVTETET